MALDGFSDALSAAAARVEAALESILPPVGDGGQGRLAAAMRHAALGGGKRLRAFLAIESAALFGAPETGADRAAAAVELLHAYSLVHDDLPCMDDDEMRRGRPTVHVAWDEATAVLAGDALQTLAFETLADPRTAADPLARAELCLALARASGWAGMAGGQALDLAAEDDVAAPDPLKIRRLQALKTGALIGFAAESGPILAGVGAEHRERLSAFARELGAAFQIRDDLLDVEASATETGKRTGKDAAAGKATFVGALGVEGARQLARERIEAARAALTPYGDRAATLAAAADYAVARRA